MSEVGLISVQLAEISDDIKTVSQVLLGLLVIYVARKLFL